MNENKILESFLEAGLWSTMDFDGNYLDENYSIADIRQEFKTKSLIMIKDFIGKAVPYLFENELDGEGVGHDLWLTIHGHGAGFWDGAI